MSRIFDMASGQNLSSKAQETAYSHPCPIDRQAELALRLLSVAESEEPQVVPPRPRPWFIPS